MEVCVEEKEDRTETLRLMRDRSKPPDCSDEPEPSDTKLRADSPADCLSMKSDFSREEPPNFTKEPGTSDTKLRAESTGSSCLSMKSDFSREEPPNFSREPGPSDTNSISVTKKKCLHRGGNRTDICEEDQPSCCSLCQDVLKDPVSASCGHWFCRRCITSHWDQSAPSGLPFCPQCEEKSSSFVQGFPSVDSAPAAPTCSYLSQPDVGLQEVLDEHKISLRRRYECVTEGTNETGSRTLLNRIYTELYITEGQCEEVNTQHEVTQLETISKIRSFHETPIRCQDIFKTLPDQHGPIRVVLTNGVAGVGKTFSVQKFTLDWAEGLENQDVSVVVLLSFRELNLIREERFSLLRLLHVFHPTLERLPAEKLSVCKLLFIFDGLDESKLQLDFSNSQLVSDVTQEVSLNVLLTNLIKGNLLPSALVWITTRPAAANQIPPSCVDRLTDVRGFTDAQKDEYFEKRFTDEDLSYRIISHIKNSRSLHIMCGIPVYCWITATVLEHMLTTEQRAELPKTMTDMYSHFLLVQTNRKKNKYHEGAARSSQELIEADREVLLKLGRLAFEHLEKGNIMFYQEDLEQCGLDVTEASVYSGVCTEIFKRECVIFQKAIYCFVHLSIQEFLAAVYMFHCFTNRKTEVLRRLLGRFMFKPGQRGSLNAFLYKVLEKSLSSEKGHLDLFVRFLHGLSMESNQKLLGGLLGQTENSPEIMKRIIKNLKKINSLGTSPDRCINIFHCLNEMNDLSVHQEIQEFLRSKKRSEKVLSETHCSALAYMLQMSEEVLDELDLLEYNTSKEGRWRLIPAVRNCRVLRIGDCDLSEAHWEVLASAMKSNSSLLKVLDLRNNINLENSGLNHLCSGLESSNCKLEVLRLENCDLTEISCALLVSALKSNSSHLTELDLSNNEDLTDSGVTELCGFLESSHCELKTLRLRSCSLSNIGCALLVSALKSNPSHLTELDLSFNGLQEIDIQQLLALVENPVYKLETLRWKSDPVSEMTGYKHKSVNYKTYRDHVDLDDMTNYDLDETINKDVDCNDDPGEPINDGIDDYDDYDDPVNDGFGDYDDYDDPVNDGFGVYDDYDYPVNDGFGDYDDYDYPVNDGFGDYDDYDYPVNDGVDYDDYD